MQTKFIAVFLFLINLDLPLLSLAGDPIIRSANEDEAVSNLVAVIKKEQGQPVSAYVNMGEARPGTNRKYRLKLRNETSDIVEFDNIATGCQCVDLQTIKGKVEPLDITVVEFSLKVDANPRAIENGGSMFFRQGDRLAFQLRYVYRISDHVGFSGSLAVVTAPRNTSSKNPIEFTVPIVAGADLDPSNVGIIINGIKGEFSFVVKPNDQVVSCKLDLNEEEFDRLYGSLNLVDLVHGRTSQIPLVIERETALKLMPPIVRFVRDNSENLYIGHIYLRSPLPDSQPSVCVVEAKLGQSLLASSYDRTSSGLGRISIRLSRDVWDSFLDEDGPAVRPEKISLNVLIGEHRLLQLVPFTLSEVEKLES